jgi:RluA family pseudouridine synthase
MKHRGDQIEILYEDDHVIAVNKPANLLVLPDRYNASLPHLLGMLKESKGKIFVVHRIDKETSGLILFARTPEAHAALNHDFRKHLVRKTYLALARGKASKKEGEIDLPIVASRRERGRMIVDEDSGKESLTYYVVLEEFNGFSLVEAKPESGRTHQIRIHLSSIGLPIVADSVYGNGRPLFLSSFKPRYKSSGEERPLIDRLALHASSIVVKHPAMKKRLELSAEPPRDMRAALNALRKYAQPGGIVDGKNEPQRH